MAMRGELDACKSANACSIDGNSNLQGQIASLNNHIKVVSGQNAALTTELNSFVQANEALRLQLDRKARVHEIRSINEEKIMMSTHNIHRSRSPIRGPHPLEAGPIGVHRVMPVFEDRVVERHVPVMGSIDAVPMGRIHADIRSRSPLLNPAYLEASRLSAATPTVQKQTNEK